MPSTDLLAPISRNLIAPLWAARERSPYLRHYRGMLRTQFDSPERIRERQDEAVRSIVAHAYETAPFWKGRLDAARLAPKDIAGCADLARLPLLTKGDLREQGGEMLSRNYCREELCEHKTSGSTGVSVVTYRDEACQQFKRGATLRADEWSGWRLGERIAAVWGNPQIRTGWKGRLRRALLERHYLYLDTLKMDQAAIGAFVDGVLRKPPSMIFGHAHSLYLVALFIESQRPEAKIRPKAILSTCMVLHDFERAKVEEVFNCKVTNRYGCEEVSLIACECERHEGLHVNSDCVYVEILDERGVPCEPGVPGRVVVTDLANRAMPMIRYEVGDMARWAESPCSCGRTLPLLAGIEGRVADYVVTPNGELISGISLTENFAVMVPGVAQLQIVQEEIARFTFRIVRGSDYDEESERCLAELVRERFGPDVAYACDYVDRILPEPSGKYRFCISKVKKSFV